MFMNFAIDKSQKEIQKAAREFGKGEFDKDLAQEMDTQHRFPEDIWKAAADLGFIGIHFPEKYVGGGLGHLENTLVAEELCRKDATIGGAIAMASLATECLVRFGSEELKQRFVPEVTEGRMLSGAALFETGGGFNLDVCATTAEKDGDDWVIQGEKAFVINGQRAGFFCVLCRTNADDKTAAGISMILVEADRSGISSDDSLEKLGFRMTPMCHVKFDGVRVPQTNLIGKEGQGVKQAEIFMNDFRLLVAAMALGIAEGAYDRALDYVKQREQFGRKLAQFQITQHKIADMAIKIEEARYLTYAAAWNQDQKKPDEKLPGMAKVVAARAALEVSSEAIQLLGGYGYMTEYDVERFYRDAKNAEILAGTGSVIKDKIAPGLIGRIK
jgi:alkylation response protein AidB-like acyl-CoA dehydrogenase